jgi:hypothetical protein
MLALINRESKSRACMLFFSTEPPFAGKVASTAALLFLRSCVPMRFIALRASACLTSRWDRWAGIRFG